VDPRASLHAVAKREILVPAENRTPVVQTLTFIFYQTVRLR